MKINITSKPGSTTKNKTGGWRTYVPKTDLDKCIGCGTCARVCPENAITMITKNPPALKLRRGKQKPKTNYDFCKGCGICAEECPVKCIKMVLEAK